MMFSDRTNLPLVPNKKAARLPWRLGVQNRSKKEKNGAAAFEA
jgi:hypothetical protein